MFNACLFAKEISTANSPRSPAANGIRKLGSLDYALGIGTHSSSAKLISFWEEAVFGSFHVKSFL